jgi:hypothetical protein
METDECVSEPGTKVRTAGRDRFRPSADLEHAGHPGVRRHEVIDDEGCPGIGLDISILLCRRDVMSADVDGAEIAIVAKGAPTPVTASDVAKSLATTSIA